MKWILWIAAPIVALIGLAALIGAMLPVRHHASRRARFRTPPGALYDLLAGPPDWRTRVKSYGALPEENGRKRWWEDNGRGRKIAFELVDARPGERLQTRIADRNLPFGGAWTFEIAPAPDGSSELRIAEDGEIYNVIFRFMARFVFGYHASIETYLKDVGAKLQQPVRIEA